MGLRSYAGMAAASTRASLAEALTGARGASSSATRARTKNIGRPFVRLAKADDMELSTKKSGDLDSAAFGSGLQLGPVQTVEACAAGWMLNLRISIDLDLKLHF
jgi:hypothetical protein